MRKRRPLTVPCALCNVYMFNKNQVPTYDGKKMKSLSTCKLRQLIDLGMKLA